MKEVLKRGWNTWKEIARAMGDFQARWLLTVFYFTVAVPFGILARCLGDALGLRRLPTGSGWLARKTPERPLEQSRRQF